MKARHVDLTQAFGIEDAMRRIAIVRFSELLTLAPALQSGNARDLHGTRIACKRLRYALERFTNREPSLLEAASRLAQLQDALGDWHDCAVLLSMLPSNLTSTSRRIRRERDDALSRARALWHDGFATFGPFTGLVHFTGLGYTV